MPDDSDVFISYAHNDNRAPKGKDGWVTDFHRDLKDSLSLHLGREAIVFRDPGLGPMSVLWDSIQNKIAKSKLFLVVSSLRYHESPSCKKEVDFFVQNFGNEKNLTVIAGTSQQRIVKVGRTKVERATQYECLRPLLPKDFFVEDDMTGHIRIFKRGMEEYEDAIEDLAQSMSAAIKAVEASQRAVVTEQQ